MINKKKKEDRSKNPTSKTKRERRKRFSKIKNVLHGGLGKRVFSGMGDSEELYCDICKERVYSVKIEKVDGKFIRICKECSK